MANKEWKELLQADPIEHVTLDLELIRKNLPEYSNEKICEMIVCDRYFGLEKKITVMCMEELAARRLTGDPLDFESYITAAEKTLPVLNFTMPDIRTILTQAAGKKFK